MDLGYGCWPSLDVQEDVFFEILFSVMAFVFTLW